MSELTDARWALYEAVSTALPELPIFAAPPSAPTAPCIIISTRGGQQVTARMWEQVYRLTVVAPGGDNEAAIRSIESSIWQLALELSRTLAAEMSWEPVAQTIMAGQTCLIAYMDVRLDITE
jgi:hypothetical protein